MEEHEKNEPNSGCKANHSAHRLSYHLSLPPWTFWLTLVTTLLACFAIGVTIRYDVALIREWQKEVETSGVTKKELEVEKLILQKEIEKERLFARSICYELLRLSKLVGHPSVNDCSRP